MEQMRVQAGITVQELVRRMQVSERTIKRDITTLRTLGYIAREGADKNGQWIVKYKN